MTNRITAAEARELLDGLNGKDALLLSVPNGAVRHLARSLIATEAERDALRDRIAVVGGALRTMIYETTHLSGERDDGSHRCIISRATLSQARAALQPAQKEQTDE